MRGSGTRKLIPVIVMVLVWPHVASAQFLNSLQQGAVAMAANNRSIYPRLPSWLELTPEQQRLMQTHTKCPSGAWETCWKSQSEEIRAVFFMITYMLEKTEVNGKPLIGNVRSVEGVLVPERARHHHAPTNVTREVDGWRIHLMITGISVADLRKALWTRDRLPVHDTHKYFEYIESFRDYRLYPQYEGPFLQLVFNAANDSSDSDLDKGKPFLEHDSAPKDVYDRFRLMFPEIQQWLVVG